MYERKVGELDGRRAKKQLRPARLLGGQRNVTSDAVIRACPEDRRVGWTKVEAVVNVSG